MLHEWQRSDSKARSYCVEWSNNIFPVHTTMPLKRRGWYIVASQVELLYYPLLKHIRYGNKSHFVRISCSGITMKIRFGKTIHTHILCATVNFQLTRQRIHWCNAIMESVWFEWIVVNGTDDVAFIVVILL